MYCYGGSLYKKNGSLKSQLNRKPRQELSLTEETCFPGLKILKKNDDNKEDPVEMYYYYDNEDK